jgi:hypothetical protein
MIECDVLDRELVDREDEGPRLETAEDMTVVANGGCEACEKATEVVNDSCEVIVQVARVSNWVLAVEENDVKFPQHLLSLQDRAARAGIF